MSDPQKTVTAQATWGDFAKWGGAFAVYAVVVIALSDSEAYGEVGTALAWVVAAGSIFYWWNAFDTSLASMIGQPPSTT